MLNSEIEKEEVVIRFWLFVFLFRFELYLV